MKRFRSVLAGITILAFAIAGCAPSTAPSQSSSPSGTAGQSTPAPAQEAPKGPKQKLVVSGWGGGWENAMRPAVIETFEKKYNAEVTLTLPGNSTQILAKLRAEKGNPSVDVMLIGGGLEEVAAKEGLMETIDWAKALTNYNDVHAAARNVPGYGPSIAFSGIGVAYNTEKIKAPPSSWMDFWKPEYKGKIGINNMDGNFGLAHFALVNKALGGSNTNVEPGFAKFKELMANQPMILKNTDDAVNALTQKDGWLVVMTNSRAVQLMKEGLPVGFLYPKEGGFAWGNYAGVPLGSKNKDLAIKFIDHYLDAQVQADWAARVNYGPTNVKAKLPADYKYTNELVVKDIYELDWNWINANRSAWIERWNKEVLTLLK